MATRPVLSSYEKKMLRRLLDRCDPVGDNFDDELPDLNFVEQGCSTEPFSLSELDPDLEDNLDDADDVEYDEDDRPVDRYEEMAERFGVDVDDDVVVNDQMLCEAIESSLWEENVNGDIIVAFDAAEAAAFMQLTHEDIVVEKSFTKLVHEQFLRRMAICDTFECYPFRRFPRSWKHTTTQAAQYLRHTWRGVHQIDTIRGALPANEFDVSEPTLAAYEELWNTPPEFGEESLRDRLLGPDYDDDIMNYVRFMDVIGPPAHC